jgi:beta-glucosidase
MHKRQILICCLLVIGVNCCFSQQKIYKSGWIDFNKNGRKDIYEDPSVNIDQRYCRPLVSNDDREKTNQTATLYGYGRVLKDSLPTANWKNEIWKDGIANIDEQLNGRR